jgi:hypothetical protein
MQMNISQLCLLAQSHPDIPAPFVVWLGDNFAIWEAFEAEALKVIAKGHEHYSSKTILEFLRHHSMLSENTDTPWKLNNKYTPYLARLFAMVHPHHARLFAYRTVA